MRKGVYGRVWGVPPVGSRGNAPVRGLRYLRPQKLQQFVNECLNFDVLEDKILRVQLQKIPSSEIGLAESKLPKYSRDK